MTARKPRFHIGDVFEMRVLSDLAYLHYLDENRYFTSLMRVYTTLHKTRPTSIESMLAGPSFYKFYPLRAASRDPVRLELVGNFPLSGLDDPLPRFKSRLEKDSLGGLTIVQGIEEVTAERKTYYFPGACGYAVVQHDILKFNGINIPFSELCEPDPSDDADARFFLQFARKRDALIVARECTISGLKHKISRDDDGARWDLVFYGFYGNLSHTVDDIDKHLMELAATHEGEFDGHELRVK